MSPQEIAPSRRTALLSFMADRVAWPLYKSNSKAIGLKYEAAAKMYQRFAREMSDNIELQKEVKEVSKLLSNVRG